MIVNLLPTKAFSWWDAHDIQSIVDCSNCTQVGSNIIIDYRDECDDFPSVAFNFIFPIIQLARFIYNMADFASEIYCYILDK